MRLAPVIAALSLLAPSAWAVPVTYNFTGTVTQVGSSHPASVSVGTVLPIVIAVDTAFPATPPGSGQFVANGLFDPVTMLSGAIQSATFGGEDRNSFLQDVIVQNNAIHFDTFTPQVSAGFTLDLGGAPVGTFPTLDLPLTIAPSLFATGTFSVTEAFSPAINGYSGVINGLATAVPEPASLILLGAGIAAVARTRHRRKA